MPSRLRLAAFLALLPCFVIPLPAAGIAVELRDVDGKPIPDAVLSLAPLDAPVPPPPSAPVEGVEIAQLGEEYRPYVTVVRTGTSVEFPNKDAIQHHIYSVSRAKPFEKPLYESGASESVLFDRPGVVTLGCNIHDWMVAYVLIVDTPWFALSDAAGAASVADLPPGRYTLEIWHPRLARPVSREILVTADSDARESFQLKLKPDRRIRRAPSGGAAKSY